MSKASFFVRRVFQAAVTLWAMMTMIFVMFRLMPGDPTAYIVSPQMDAEVRRQIIESYGLNDPIRVQYVKFLGNVLELNLGRSFHTKVPVSDVILTYLPNTLVLMFASLIVAYTVGVTVGVFAGWYRGTRLERNVVFTALMARSIPAFWVGLIVLWIFGAWLQLIPMAGMSTAGTEESFWAMVLSFDFVRHSVAPVLVLAFYYMGYPLLLMRNSMLDVLSEDFIEVCRAKGLSERAIMFKHAARNALLPILTATAIAISFAVGGNILIETVFGWPGIGREMIRAVLRRDYPVAQGTFLVLASAVIVMNFVADLLYGYLDPRVTY
jgi:peptide/nickel transport system permease protein